MRRKRTKVYGPQVDIPWEIFSIPKTYGGKAKPEPALSPHLLLSPLHLQSLSSCPLLFHPSSFSLLFPSTSFPSLPPSSSNTSGGPDSHLTKPRVSSISVLAVLRGASQVLSLAQAPEVLPDSDLALRPPWQGLAQGLMHTSERRACIPGLGFSGLEPPVYILSPHFQP